MRECLNCFSNETLTRSNGSEVWLRHDDGFICHTCYNKLISNPKRTKEYIKKYNDKRTPEYNKKYNDRKTPEQIKNNNDKRIMLRFGGKQILLNENPRTGYCSICRNNIFDGSCKITHIHHLEYHDGSPLKDTVELCPSCHRKQHIGQDEYSW